jgi:hypothetical protein
MYSSAFCRVGLQAYNLKSHNLSLDEATIHDTVFHFRFIYTTFILLQVFKKLLLLLFS